MAKKVALITSFAHVAELHSQTLKHLFGDEIDLHCYSYDIGTITGPISADIYIISIYQIYLNVRKYISINAKVIIINNTITEEQYQKISVIPPGTSVLMVNYSVEMTMDTISLFHQLGLNHIQFVPCFPGLDKVPRLKIAVTSGELKHVPSFVKQVIDIGIRVIDIRTLFDIATGLGLDRLLKEARFVDYFNNIRKSPDSVTSLFARTSTLESQLSGLLEVLDDGILIIDSMGMVYAGNQKAREVLHAHFDLAGHRAVDLIPDIHFQKVLESGVEVDHTLVRIHSRMVSVKVVPVLAQGEARGLLAIVNTFEEKEKSQHRLRTQLLGKGHRSHYTFDSILTEDPKFLENKELACKKAKSDASVLIIGETGTGKELFAHAIHHASRRRDWQFVTVNCAALPENLLESELFGYDEGGFTGARKGGKPGLFELAHKGTIFLDEIGEMYLNLQARLLRVLESKDVMRIGGDSRISVDVRVIAATNKDLKQLVEEGKFRRDLYYRLNVLPINVVPLRERKSDIPLLVKHFERLTKVGFRFSSEAMAILLEYPWPGNIRELKNLVDYLAFLEKDLIDVQDIDPIIQMPTVPSPVEVSPKFNGEIAPDLENRLYLLECLYDCYQRKVRIGRRGLCQQAKERNIFLSEGNVRKLLIEMERTGHVRTDGGRSGTSITRMGIAMVESKLASKQFS